MQDENAGSSRRKFLTRMGAAALSAPLMATPAAAMEEVAVSLLPKSDWDLSWVARIKRAKHRAVFDMPSGDFGLQLVARYLENVETVHAAKAPDVVAVLNARTRAITVALTSDMWAKYPIAEDANIKDQGTGKPARKNPNYIPDPDALPVYATISLKRLYEQGMIILVCDFALGHLSSRLAANRSGSTADEIHAELRANLVAGAISVPSGIFALGETQNLGCAFIPS